MGCNTVSALPHLLVNDGANVGQERDVVRLVFGTNFCHQPVAVQYGSMLLCGEELIFDKGAFADLDESPRENSIKAGLWR